MKMHKSSLGRLACALVISILLASSANAADRDGNWWGAKSRADKLEYMIGFFDGMQFQDKRVTQELLNPLAVFSFDQPCDQMCVKLRLDQSGKHWRSIQSASKDFNNVTAGQLVDGCDSVYADYKNRSISVVDVLDVVMWSIKGVAAELIEGRLVHLRKGG